MTDVVNKREPTHTNHREQKGVSHFTARIIIYIAHKTLIVQKHKQSMCKTWIFPVSYSTKPRACNFELNAFLVEKKILILLVSYEHNVNN